MSTASRNTAPSSIGIDGLQSAFSWSAAFAEALMQVQRMQLDALLAWQQALAAVQQELWDEWAVRWAGGAPIDA